MMLSETLLSATSQEYLFDKAFHSATNAEAVC